MKIIIQNQQIIELNLKCKSCNKIYQVNFEEISQIPIWKYESCSKKCAIKFSPKKLLTLKINKKKPNLA